MCEMLTAADDSSKCQVVLAEEAEEVPMGPAHQAEFSGDFLLL